jgi:hypothetical protein
MPADILWRLNMEGPKMELNIPFQRAAGGLLILLVLLGFVTGAISGYDTGRDGFEVEATRLADLSTFADNMNAVFRIATGLGLIAVAACLYVTLRERSPLLATLATFGLVVAGVLALVANAMQIVFVELAEEYVATSGDEQARVLTAARTVALMIETTTWAAIAAFMASVYTLAVLAGREQLVPRWLIGLPVLSAGLIAVAFAGSSAGAGDSFGWVVMMSGLMMGIVWLLIAGIMLVLTRDLPALNAPTTPQPDPV